MYNTKFECRYNKDGVFLETDDVTDDEKVFIRNILYREDMLNIFSVDSNDDFDVFTSVIIQLYSKIKDCQPFKKCMKKIAMDTVMSEDEVSGLMVMYSYDYMYITHKCVSEYLDTGNLSQENIELLDKISK